MNFGDLPRSFWRIKFLPLIGGIEGVLVIALVVLLGTTALPQPAHADPHGVFFTVVGQQQLFFNVLAALDQADYVEPFQLRDNLVADRGAAREETPEGEQVQFAPELNELVNATDTDLSSIVTRPITLEGNDLWTAYLVHQFNLEQIQQKKTNELLTVFCERGLGLTNCDDDADSQNRDKVAVIDPSQERANFVEAGVGVLLSGSDADRQARRDFIDPEKEDEYKIPLPYDPYLAAARNSSVLQANDVGRGLFESAVADVASASKGAVISRHLFENIGRKSDGTYEVAGTDSVEEWVRDMQSIYSTKLALRDSLSAGQAEYAAYQALVVDGIRPDTKAVEETDSNGNNISRGVEITNPAYARQAVIQTIGDLAADKATSQRYDSFGGPLQVPGGVAGVSDGRGAGVAGATSVNQGQEGKVLGVFDFLEDLLQFFTQDEADAVNALVGEGWAKEEEPSCGWCFDLLDWF